MKTALLIGILIGGLSAVAYLRPAYLVPVMSLVVGCLPLREFRVAERTEG